MINNINNSNQSLNHSNNDIFKNKIKFQNNINLNLSNYNFYNIIVKGCEVLYYVNLSCTIIYLIIFQILNI